MPKFSIVIPSWNGRHFLKTCLRSLGRQTCRDFEVIVIDNGSTDQSVPYIKKSFPHVRVIALPVNIGFAPAINRGIEKAQGELIALLNNDTEIDKRWLSEILKAADSHRDVAFFASKMLDFQDRSIIDSCGDAMTWSGRSYKIGECQKDTVQYQKERYVFGACGGAAVYRRELFKKIGCFDEDFFAYLEDVDLDFRAQLMGLKCLFVPSAIVYHIGSATAGKKSAFSFRLMARNHQYVIWKNFPLTKLLKHSCKIVYSEIRLLGAAWRDGFLKEYFSAHVDALRHILPMLKKRHHIQKSRRATGQELDRVIESNFSFKTLKNAWQDRRKKH